jgi:putative endonuclease
LAAAHLLSLGFDILVTNYRWRRGEIDLVAREGVTLCFVEVRSRGGPGYGPAAGSVDAAKQHRIARAAEHFLATTWKQAPCPCRFDVVSVDSGKVTLYRDAFRL